MTPLQLTQLDLLVALSSSTIKDNINISIIKNSISQVQIDIIRYDTIHRKFLETEI